MPMSAMGSRTMRPATVTVPSVAGRSPATMRSRVDLPQPLGPTSETNSPAPTRQRNAGEGLDRAARRLVCHADPVEADQFACSRRDRFYFGISTLVRKSVE